MSVCPKKLPGLALIGWEPDWETFYINGRLSAEGHHIDSESIERAVANFASAGYDAKVYRAHVELDEADEFEEHIIPQRLEDIPPLALERLLA